MKKEEVYYENSHEEIRSLAKSYAFLRQELFALKKEHEYLKLKYDYLERWVGADMKKL